MSEVTTVWREYGVPAGDDVREIPVGPLLLRIRCAANEIWVSHERTDGEVPSLRDGGGEWTRWALPGEAVRVRLQPVMPDRLLVVNPDDAFTLVRGAEARVYARVPAWVRIVAVGARGGEWKLSELPTVVLSDTWWGDFFEGQLGYWLPTRARRVLTDLPEEHMILATLQLKNVSSDDLPVEKLALRVEHLSIYEKDGTLWAEEVMVEYRGEAEGSDIRMDDHPPAEAAGAREITPARAQTRSFRARTFSRLKAFSGWGGWS